MSDIGKARYGWSKWGGAMYGLVKTEGEWFCQGCGQEQPPGVPQYLFPWDQRGREYIRLCSVCKHIQVKNKIKRRDVRIVITHIRKKTTYG